MSTRQRPAGLQSRATSAPAGELFRLVNNNNAKTGHDDYSSSVMGSVTIAVVGGAKVGKSAFIKRALGLKVNPTSQSTTRTLSAENTAYAVRLLEIQARDVDFDRDGISLPPLLDDGHQATPKTVDGFLVLHDFTRPEVMPKTSCVLGEFFIQFV